MRIAIGLSGGVDSSVAALLLKRGGHDIVGISMNLWEAGRYPDHAFEACFGPGAVDAIAEAKRFADQIGIPYEIFDCADKFEKEVLSYFKAEREAGRTPNPCVVCNQALKFGLLPEIAVKKLNCEKFATGHYVRLKKVGDRYHLMRAIHKGKDQSYFLWRLSQDQLSRAYFPLGEMTKDEVRECAREAKLAMAEKADSQDFYSGDSNELLKIPPKEGMIVDLNGKVLAKHQGYWNFTVGQRKGLGFATGTPMYVIAIDPKKNEVTVGTREEAMFTSFDVEKDTINWVSYEPTAKQIECRVKVRSAGEPVGPVIFENGHINAPDGIFGVAPGQSAVFYDLNSDDLLFGGVISSK